MLLFALPEARDIGAPLAQALNTTLAPLEVRSFEDGEFKLRPLTPVRDADIYVVQSLHSADGLSVHDRLCRLLFFMSVLRDHGAARITVICPYLCYGRKDRRTKPFDPLTLRYVAQIIEAAGCDRLMTLEAHNVMAFQNAFRCETLHLEMATVFVGEIARDLSDKPLCVMSPDPGGIKRAQLFREALEAEFGEPVEFAFRDKRRSGGIRTSGAFAGDVAGKRVIIVDDMIVSGGTLLSAARAALEFGAYECVAVAAHGLFAQGSETLFETPELSRVMVSDSVSTARATGAHIVSAIPALASRLQELTQA